MAVVDVETTYSGPLAGGMSFGRAGPYRRTDGVVTFAVDPDNRANQRDRRPRPGAQRRLGPRAVPVRLHTARSGGARPRQPRPHRGRRQPRPPVRHELHVQPGRSAARGLEGNTNRRRVPIPRRLFDHLDRMAVGRVPERGTHRAAGPSRSDIRQARPRPDGRTDMAQRRPTAPGCWPTASTTPTLSRTWTTPRPRSSCATGRTAPTPRYRPRSGGSLRETAEGVVPSAEHVYLESGFQPGRIYHLVYTTEGAPVVGAGLLAVREAATWLRNPSPLNPVDGGFDRAYAFGSSQTGRLLRHFVSLGLNLDEDGRPVFDGFMPHVAGGRRGEFNHRFAQPSVQSTPGFGHLFPFADNETADPHTGRRFRPAQPSDRAGRRAEDLLHQHVGRVLAGRRLPGAHRRARRTRPGPGGWARESTTSGARSTVPARCRRAVSTRRTAVVADTGSTSSTTRPLLRAASRQPRPLGSGRRGAAAEQPSEARRRHRRHPRRGVGVLWPGPRRCKAGPGEAVGAPGSRPRPGGRQRRRRLPRKGRVESIRVSCRRSTPTETRRPGIRLPDIAVPVRDPCRLEHSRARDRRSRADRADAGAHAVLRAGRRLPEVRRGQPSRPLRERYGSRDEYLGPGQRARPGPGPLGDTCSTMDVDVVVDGCARRYDAAMSEVSIRNNRR